MVKQSPTDAFLGKRLKAYDTWLEKKLISHSSRVIPVAASFTPEQWVLPGDQVRTIIETVRTVAVQNCECRSHYKRCDNPLEVCLVFNRVAEKLAALGTARIIQQKEAEKILDQARQHGLVHLSLYMPDHEVYALCSCCTCCCHDLQIVKQYGRKELMARSQYMAVTCSEDCLACGNCTDICPFGARVLQGDQLLFRQENCLGCGLCVSACPFCAVSMVQRI